jgi:hypothetical protein
MEVAKMEKTDNNSTLIKIEEAARELSTTPLRILMLIREGAMKGRQVEDKWYVEKKSMACFRDYGTDNSKPGGCKGSCSSGGCPSLD